MSAEIDNAFTGSVPAFCDSQMVPLIFEPYVVDLANRLRGESISNLLQTAAGTGALTRALRTNRGDPCRFIHLPALSAFIPARCPASFLWNVEGSLPAPAGWEQLKPTGGFGHWVAVARNAVSTTGKFRAWQPAGWVRTAIWNDVNGNGRVDDNQALPMSVRVFVDEDDDGVLDVNESARDVQPGTPGAFFVRAGKVTLRAVTPPRWRQTFPTSGAAVVGAAVPRQVRDLGRIGVQRVPGD